MSKLSIALRALRMATPLAIKTGKKALEMRKSSQGEHLRLLNEIHSELVAQNSFKNTFRHGIVRGVGTAIGATVIAGILLTILARAVTTVDDVPILRDVIDRVQVITPE